MLKPSALGLINLQSKISDRFKLLSHYLSLAGPHSETCSEDVIDELRKLGIEHQFIITESHSDISSCFKNGKFNPDTEGKMLLSFWLRTWWDDIPSRVKEKLVEDLHLLVSKNKKEELIMRDAYIWIAQPKN